MFNDVRDSSSFQVSASLDGEHLTGEDIRDLELVRSRRALAYLKQKLGKDAMLALLKGDLDATTARVAEWARTSAGEWATGVVTLELPGLQAEAFEHWFMDAIRRDDEPTLRAGHPDHFLNHPRPGAPAEVIENVGEDELPWHIFLTFHGRETEFPTPWDPAFTHCFGVFISDRDGTRIGSALHEMRDSKNGMIAKLTIHLPAAAPSHLVRGHLRHFSIEFRNWAELASTRLHNES
ncbi:hypothetical protein [Streptomyces sp. YIM S03343]